jgi:hypothetical protein
MPTHGADAVVGGGASLRAPADRKRLSASAIRLFLNTADLLSLTVDQRRAILGDVSEATYHNWRKEPGKVVLARDQLERVSLTLGILKALRLIFAEDATAFRWLRAANADHPFDGRSPLDVMTAGGIIDLYSVRRYLDAWRGVR